MWFWGACPDEGRNPLGNRIHKRGLAPASGDDPAEQNDEWYVRDASGNEMAVYRQEQIGDTLYTYLVEHAIYGSDRLGLDLRGTVMRKACVASPPCPEEDTGLPSNQRIMLLEVMYDSPLTPDDTIPGAESHLGEYIQLYNAGTEPADLSSYQLRQGTQTFNLTGTIPAGGRLFIAHGTDPEDLFDIVESLSGRPLQMQTEITLPDGGSVLELLKDDQVQDQLPYGAFYRLDAENSYLSDNSLKTVRKRGVIGVLGGPIGPPVVGGLGATVDVIDPDGEPVVLDDAIVGRFNLARGVKRYELKNHLGNVLAVVTDVKLGDGDLGVSPAEVDFYLPEVVEVSDYYPFGSKLPFRYLRSGALYRFGFQAMELDMNWFDGDDHYTTYFRQHDTRIGRWLSVDPKDTPNFSSFTSLECSPLVNVDPLGDRIKIVGFKENGKYTKASLFFHLRVRSLLIVARTIGPQEVRSKIAELQRDPRTHFIMESDAVLQTGAATLDNFNVGEDDVVYRDDLEKGETFTEVEREVFGPKKGQLTLTTYEGTGAGTAAEMILPKVMPEYLYTKDKDISGKIFAPNWGRGVIHEIRHMWDWAFGHNTKAQTPNGLPINERNASHFENQFIRRMHIFGLWKEQKPRAEYSGKPLSPKDRK